MCICVITTEQLSIKEEMKLHVIFYFILFLAWP